MIINIRGTSGSGKTHLVRAIMGLSPVVSDWYGSTDTPVDMFGGVAIRPAGHIISTPTGACYVLGNYVGVQCGGCDQLMKEPWNLSRDGVYAKIREAAVSGHVIYEGLLIAEVHRCVALVAEGHEVLVVHIVEPVEVCLDAVNARRAQRGRGPVDPKHTLSKHKELENQSRRLMDAGVTVAPLKRDAAFRLIKERLGWQC